MKINLPYFILYVFCIGFVADIILLALSKINFGQKTSFNALKPYFDHYNYLSPVLAGITCVIGASLTLLVFYVIDFKNIGFFTFLLLSQKSLAPYGTL